MRVSRDDGVVLNAEFGVEVDGGHLAVVLESGGGRVSGAGPARNHEYVAALDLLLARLAARDAVLLRALLASARVSGWPESERLLLDGPISLASGTAGLRKKLTRAQGVVGRAEGAVKEGNNRKRILLRVEVPGYTADDPGRLARDLAAPAAGLPAEADPDLLDALADAERTAGRTRRSGQGRGLTQPEKVAVERRAMDLATDHLTSQGWTTRDVGATHSYDIDATRPGEHLHVEVKGTTSAGDDIILTRGEVELMTEKYPHTMLIVVHDIHLDRTTTTPQATAGTLDIHSPWKIDPDRLTPISYQYRTEKNQQHVR
ncbi:DUF3883 domain-containing protein [Actinokineospora sp. PR83]|uniref:DUF3883 domain-containing protein n=1 Tax=Actinokineospora sp. PR83 TaxID=2884908 RepID=UPI001F3DDCDB|nr:DUF3883 domain-containing protein [Actinokineospora sp. PR83]MCG8917164.1 DUF3883 domain-containing protein [Actinokineospora sp. PR83]